MSWQLDQERGKKGNIEMPPLAEEPVKQAETQQQVHPNVAAEFLGPHEVHPEIAQEFVQPVEAQEEVQQEEVEEVKLEVKVDSKKEQDLRVLREKAKRADLAERERDEYARRLREYEQQVKQTQKPVEEEPETEYGPDDLVEAKYLKRYDKKIRELEDKVKSTEQHATLQNVEARLKAKYPDFDKVVSTENIEILKATYPDLAESLSTNPDVYSKASAAYTLIKKLGIAQEDTYMEDKQKAQKNAIKPRPLASVNAQQGDSPLSKANAFANGLTDELKAQLRKEMENARRNM